jgi:hypothetical protein
MRRWMRVFDFSWCGSRRRRRTSFYEEVIFSARSVNCRRRWCHEAADQRSIGGAICRTSLICASFADCVSRDEGLFRTVQATIVVAKDLFLRAKDFLGTVCGSLTTASRSSGLEIDQRSYPPYFGGLCVVVYLSLSL